MNNDDYVMVKTKKLCPMCIIHDGTIPIEQLKLCNTHKGNKKNEWFNLRKDRR